MSEPLIPSFVHRRGRVSDNSRKLYDELKDRFFLPSFPDSEFSLCWKDLFPSCDSFFIEIGFGMGDATWRIAQENPSHGYLGVEVHRPGVIRLMRNLQKHEIENVLIFEGEARGLLESSVPKGSLSGVHLFFPDPWPKARHHKRRLFTTNFIDQVSTLLKPEGYLYFVTDWEEYADFALEQSKKSLLENPHSGFSPPQESRPQTKYERKALAENRSIYELMLRKP